MFRSPLMGLLLLTLLLSAGAYGSGTGGGEDVESAKDALLGKGWTLVALKGGEPDPGPAVTLRFEEEGTLGGSDGCNRYHGTFSVDGSKIQISPKMAMTMVACPEPLAVRARAYTGALDLAAAFAIEGNRLSLRDSADLEVAGFEAASLRLAGTSWRVLSYNNGKQAVVSLIIGTRITASFGEDGRVTGSAGCNRYFAGYEAEDESITIGMAAATRRFCGDPQGIMDQEASYLAALQSVATLRLEGDKLTLRTADGALALTLVRDAGALSGPASPPEAKIRFDLDKLDSQGLQGPPGGLRALHYEYCIPDRPEAIQEVSAIDPTLEIQGGSPGRVGCREGKLLCLGHTHQPGHREILERLAALSTVKEIREAFFE